MLMTQVTLLEQKNVVLEKRATAQDERIQTLESLVTQRAKVDEVLKVVVEIKEKLDAS